MRKTITQISMETISEEDYLSARLDDLPPWVVFPDFEKSDWLNGILKKFWPIALERLNQSIMKAAENFNNFKILEFKFGKSVSQNSIIWI